MIGSSEYRYCVHWDSNRAWWKVNKFWSQTNLVARLGIATE